MFTLQDGRPLDDAEPQDIARELAKVFDRLGVVVAKNNLAKKERTELSELLSRVGAIMRTWANFGRWIPRRLHLADKAAARITPMHLQALRYAVDGTDGYHLESRELVPLVEDLLRHLRPKVEA